MPHLLEHRHIGDVCPPSLIWTLDNPIRRLIHNPRRILAGMIREGQTALDLGCGPGVFTLEMARMAGESGRVIALDLQAEMLAHVRARAEKQGLAGRVILHQSTHAGLGLDTPVDFVLAMWMLHEVPNRAEFIAEVVKLIKPGGRFLVVEPRIHESAVGFRRTLGMVRDTGIRQVSSPFVIISQAALFEKPSGKA
jgi:ubiquinone/menaquinone biosynthesis C-methylase UbiE